ncbi:purine-binding chemotaxis protein CheW [Bacillus ectoiniformans]|uniref:chemotaxis protein CheW n=1 Tax=Bacillus ectoiniformans TaxID=1494429 RepID=UPI00195A8F41|nr:CheW domain-containing protein [Bacillus ectoiniformans]MBM7648104.1 purine-binding chemotaxis protein CheW [Bacillus ectoiniformans]
MQQVDKTVVFESGHEEYAVPIESVISIEKVPSIQPIPHLPLYMKGVVKVRDELIPVIDFEYVLYNKSLSNLDEARLLVIQTKFLAVGFLVKDAKEIISVPEQSLRQVGLVAYSKTKYFSAVANLDNRLVTIIDPEVLVSSLDGMKEIQEFMMSYTAE